MGPWPFSPKGRFGLHAFCTARIAADTAGEFRPLLLPSSPAAGTHALPRSSSTALEASTPGTRRQRQRMSLGSSARMAQKPFDKLPVVDCEGSTPAEIGRSHGAQLRERIGATLAFYFDRFEEHGLGLEEIRRWGEHWATSVRCYSAELADEVEGVAAGAQREPWELFALQGRTELLTLALRRAGRPVPGECTSVCCPGWAVAGQNWDWDTRMDSLIVLLRLPRSEKRPQILTLTEAGILGKVGLNEHGMGVCINLLCGVEPTLTPGVVPVHILARAALSCDSLERAEALMQSAPRHCYTHVLLSDSLGRYRMAEFCGTDLAFVGKEHDGAVAPAPPAIVHTNHYLHPSFAGVDAESDLCHTRERHKRATEIIGGYDGVPGESTCAPFALAKTILGDREGQPKSILYDDAPGITPDSTLATIVSMILDLRSLEMHVTRGEAMTQEYDLVPLWPDRPSNLVRRAGC